MEEEKGPEVAKATEEKKKTSIEMVGTGAYRAEPAEEKKDGGDTYTAENQVNSDYIEQQINFFSEQDKIILKDILSAIPGEQTSDILWKDIRTDTDVLDFESNFARLLESQVMFIASRDLKHSWSLTREIVRNSRFGGLRKHQLAFPDVNSANGKYLGFKKLTQLLEQEKNLLIVADLNHNRSDHQNAFFHSLTTSFYEESLEILKENGIYLLVIIDHIRAYDIRDDNNKDYLYNYHIWELKEKGAATDLPEPKVLFNTLNPVQQILLFTATFFTRLSFRSFNTVVNFLLEADTKEKPIVWEIYGDSKKEGAKKVKKVLKENKVAVWETYKDELFQSCFLTGVPVSETKYAVDFADPAYRDKLKTYFKINHHFFWQTQITVLEELALVFNPTVSKEIANGIISLIVDSLCDDPLFYNDDWFRKMIYAIKDFSGKEFIIEGETEEEQIDNLFWEFLERNELTEFFYTRLADILTAILGTTQSSRVQSYLNSLMNLGHHDALSRLVHKLSGKPNFDVHYWIKQLIERGNADVKISAYRWLINREAIANPEKTWEVIKTWLPGERKIEKYSPSTHYACFFVVHYYVNAITGLQFSEYGKGLSKYPLFAYEKKAGSKTKEHLKFVITQFYHEGTAYQFSKDNKQLLFLMSSEIFTLHWSQEKGIRRLFNLDSDDIWNSFSLGYVPTYGSLLADIIETWFHISTGLEENSTGTLKPVSNLILKETVEAGQNNHTLFKAIAGHWEKKAAIYKQQYDRVRQHWIDDKERMPVERKELLEDFMDSIIKRRDNMGLLFEELTKHL